jgi:hypothetical protein
MFALDKANRRIRNMSQMMDRLGLDVGAFACRRLGFDLRSAIRTCQLCNEEEACRNWLVGAGKSSAHAPPFCPNARLFAQARGEQPDQ